MAGWACDSCLECGIHCGIIWRWHGWCTAADMTADVSWLEEADEGGKINKRVVSFVGGFS